MTILVLFISVFAMQLHAQRPRWTGTATGKLYGFWSDSQSAFVIEPQYAEAGYFSQGSDRIAAVKNQRGEWGYINEQNKIVIPFSDRFSQAMIFANGFASVIGHNKKWGIINRNGEIVVEMKYEYTGTYASGLLPAKNQEDLWGYLDASGKEVMPFIFSSAAPFISDGYIETDFAAVQKDNEHYMINTRGQYLDFADGISNNGNPLRNKDRIIFPIYDNDRQLSVCLMMNENFEMVMAPREGRMYFVDPFENAMSILYQLDDAMELAKGHRVNTYEEGYIRRDWEDPEEHEIGIPVIGLFDWDGGEIISLDRGYNEYVCMGTYSRVGKVYSLDGEAVMRMGLVDKNGREVLPALYHEAIWNESRNMGLIGLSKRIRIEADLRTLFGNDYNDYEDSRVKSYYEESPLGDRDFYLVDRQLKCVSRMASEIWKEMDLPLGPAFGKPDYQIGCSNIHVQSDGGFSQLNNVGGKLVKNPGQEVEIPFRVLSFFEEIRPEVPEAVRVGFEPEDRNPPIAQKISKDYKYTKEGLLAPGQKIDDSFLFHIARDGRFSMVSRKGELSPNNGGALQVDIDDYLNWWYSWYDVYQRSRNVGYPKRYMDKGKTFYYMNDWHGNKIILPESKYRFASYMDNGLLLLVEVKNPENYHVWDTRSGEVFPVPVRNLKNIYQTPDNQTFFPLDQDGRLYRMFRGAKSVEAIASDIGFMRYFEIKGIPYWQVNSRDSNLKGVIDMNGKVQLPLKYDHVLYNIRSDNPNLFVVDGGQLFSYDLERGTMKFLKNGLQFNSGWRKAFGKYAVCKDNEHHLLINEDGNEVMRMRLEDLYGQPDLCMAKKDGWWYYMNEEGENAFGVVFNNVYAFHEGLALVMLSNDRVAYINREGEIVIGPFYKNQQ